MNRLDAIRDRRFEQQRYRASGLNLVMAAIVLWNTVYQVQYLSPLRWEHSSLTGDCVWRSSAKIGAGKFRPLRSLQPA